MAWRTSAALIVALLAAPRLAAADDCDGELALTIITTRFAILPLPGPTDGLGLDLWVRGPSVTWGNGCHGGRQRFDLSELDAPDLGDRDHDVMHFGSYQYAWHAGEVIVHAGARSITHFGSNLRFVTPVVGITVEPDPDVLVHAQLESSGLFAFAMDHVARRPLDDLVLDASAVWPAAAATRGEVRTRARRYHFEDGAVRRDVTVSAGVGLGYKAARDRQRVFPAFLGLALRTGAETQVLFVAELGFGVANR